MISRRLIRIKALQILYASSRKNDVSSTNAENELFHSIEKYYDLYNLLLLLIIEIVDIETRSNDFKLQKKNPTESDLNPQLGLQNNSFVQKLKSNTELSNTIESRKLGWKVHLDFVKQLYNDFKTDSLYSEFIEQTEHSFNTDQELTIRFFTEFLTKNERFIEFLEEENIYWNDDFNFALVMIVKTIRNFKQSSSENIKLLPLFKNNDDREFAKMLIRKTIINKVEYTKLIEKHTKNWDAERIAQIDILILQLAIAEVLGFDSIPVKVTLNEYIEISKFYSTEKSKTFINGLLDKITKTLKNENKINKVGRGLIE